MIIPRPSPVRHGKRPPPPYRVNAASPHAVSLVYWVPVEARDLAVMRNTVTNSFNMLDSRIVGSGGLDAIIATETMGEVLQLVAGGVRGDHRDTLWTGGKNASSSMAVWVWIPDVSRQGVFFKNGGGSDGWGIGVGSTQTNNSGNNLQGLFEFVRFIPTGVAIGTGWHHLGMTLDGSGFPTLFLDGLNVYSDTSGAPGTPSPGVAIPYDAQNGQHCDGCYIADARLWNRQLNNAEMYEQWAPESRWDLYATASSRLIVSPGTVVAPTTKFRKTLSGIGSHVGGRQPHAWN